MSMTVTYEGHRIRSSPYRLADTGAWKAHILLWQAHHDPSTATIFTANGSYATHKDAELHGIAFGKRICDGTIPGLSVGQKQG